MARQLLLEGTRGKLPYLAFRGLIFLPNWLEVTKQDIFLYFLSFLDFIYIFFVIFKTNFDIFDII